MAYQIGKSIAALVPAFDGEPVDRILLTGGMARSAGARRTRSPGSSRRPGCGVTVYPGENEMFALVKGALRVLNRKEEAREYQPEG